MSTRKVSRVFTLLAASMAVVFTASGASPHQGDDKSPVGSWFVYICPATTDPCSTASPVINLTPFGKDGTLIGGDFGANPWPSPGLGIWGKTGPDQFATTFVELFSDAQGALVNRAKIRGALTYDHKSDTLAGRFQVDITDPSGEDVLDHFAGTALLTRMHLELLP